MKKLRILSYNIHKGFSAGAGEYTLHQMRSAIRSVKPDLIFLQEVQGEHHGHKKKIVDWPDSSQFEYLAESMWPHFTYGKNAVYTEGHHGNAILSKYPVISWENLDISQNPLEKRGLLHAVINLGSGKPKLHAICVHLNLLHRGRTNQINQLKKRIESVVPAKDLLIVAGDFNDWKSKAVMPFEEAFLKLHGRHAKTFPANMPLLPLDRVYFRGFEIHSAERLIKAPWNILSDHAPILVELFLR